MPVRRAAVLVLVASGCSSFGASANDGGAAPADAGVDAPAPADAGAPDASRSDVCAGAHTFCADFDEGALLRGWDMFEVDPAGQGELDTTTFLSAPASAHLYVPAGSPACGRAELRKALDGTHAKVRLTFDVKKGSTAGDFGAFFAARVHMGPCALDVGALASSGPDTPIVYIEPDATGNNGTTVPMSRGIPDGVWSHVVIDLDASAGKIVVTIDGVVALDSSTLGKSPWAGCPTSGTVAVDVGPHCVNASKPLADTRFDDVFVDLD